jgi:hypothetical protein
MPIYTGANPTYKVTFDGTEVLRSAEDTSQQAKRAYRRVSGETPKRAYNRVSREAAKVSRMTKAEREEAVPTVRLDGEFLFP